jgi:hypothetical protein
MPCTKIVRSFSRQGWVGLGSLILVSLVVGLLLWGASEVRAETEGSLTWSPASHDFGRVKRLGGMVSTTFTLRYQGETALVLRRIWTS